MERYCNVLPVFGFNSAKYDPNLIKSYLMPSPVNERDIERTVIKKANQFIWLKFGDIQLLDIMNVLGGAISPDSFLKTCKTSEAKGFVPYECFDYPEKSQNTELPPYDAFYSKLTAAVTLLKQNTKWNYHRASYCQIEFIKATPYWGQRSYPIFKEREENVKMKASILEADKKN